MRPKIKQSHFIPVILLYYCTVFKLSVVYFRQPPTKKGNPKYFGLYTSTMEIIHIGEDVIIKKWKRLIKKDIISIDEESANEK